MTPPDRWLLLIHQLPPKPAYLRVKIARRLQQVGAVALKNTVYVLPRSERAVEDFQWVRREIVSGGGDATVVVAALVDGLRDDQVEDLFRSTRDEEYAALAAELTALGKRAGRRRLRDDDRRELATALAKGEARLAEIEALDVFGAAGKEAAVGRLAALRERLAPESVPDRAADPRDYLGRTWVTRTGVHVDRIGSAWLVRRFVDPKATFKLVAPKGYEPAPGELRFDMYDAELTHEGDRCTFEVLCARLGLDAPGLRAIGEIVHDIDLRDGKFARPETAGVAALIHGLAARERSDDERLRLGFELFDDLLCFFARKKAPA